MEDIAARELSLYADNTEPLYRQRMAIAKNLATKKAKGVYDREKSLVAWGYLAKAAARAYVKEMGTPGEKWNVTFNKESRDAFCKAYREEFEQEYKDGEYEAILPAKYQKKATKKSTAAAMTKLAEKRDAAPTVSAPRQPPSPWKQAEKRQKAAAGRAKHKRSLRAAGKTPWRVEHGDAGWYIVSGNKKKFIGPVRGRGTNYYDKAEAEAEKRNRAL